MFLLEAADDNLGLACLGGECFGAAGAGFLRFSCAETESVMREAVQFFSNGGDARPARERVRREASAVQARASVRTLKYRD